MLLIWNRVLFTKERKGRYQKHPIISSNVFFIHFCENFSCSKDPVKRKRRPKLCQV